MRNGDRCRFSWREKILICQHTAYMDHTGNIIMIVEQEQLFQLGSFFFVKDFLLHIFRIDLDQLTTIIDILPV